MINYEIVLIMLPGTILGSLIGVQLNSILPDIATMIMLTILLFFMGYKSLFSGIKKYREETFEMEEGDSRIISPVKRNTFPNNILSGHSDKF